MRARASGMVTQRIRLEQEGVAFRAGRVPLRRIAGGRSHRDREASMTLAERAAIVSGGGSGIGDAMIMGSGVEVDGGRCI